MRPIKSMFFLFTMFLVFNSCSSDSDEGSPEETAVDLLIGEWLIQSESDYYCDSDTVYTERITDPNQIYEYNEDGTWQKYEDGVANEFQYGTWEKIAEGQYAIDHLGDDVQYSVQVEFDGNNVMKFAISECRDEGGESVYTYELHQRQ